MGGRTARLPPILRQLVQLERQGTEVLAKPVTAVDAKGRSVPGKWLLHPRKADIQAAYEEAFLTVPHKYQGQVLKGYVSNFPTAAWDPDSWFITAWWGLRARADKDRHAKRLLEAIAAGVKAPATAGVPRGRYKVTLRHLLRRIHQHLVHFYLL